MTSIGSAASPVIATSLHLSAEFLAAITYDLSIAAKHFFFLRQLCC